MIYTYRDAKIFYRFFNRHSDVTNVYLHGWGCDHKSFMFCHKHLKEQNSLFIDFPPFGESEKEVKGWTVFTYANMLIALCHHLKLKKFNLVGHSFGGRIAILVSSICKDEVEKVVLVDSAGIKPRRSICYYWKVWCYKIRKKFKMDTSKYGSCDYLALSPQMRKVFNSVVNTHLDDFLPFIRAKTLIIYGMEDKVTPIYMAKKLHKKIKNSQLTLLSGAGHFCFVDRRIEFITQLEKFI